MKTQTQSLFGTYMLVIGLATVAYGAISATDDNRKRNNYIVGAGLSIAVLGGVVNFIK